MKIFFMFVRNNVLIKFSRKFKKYCRFIVVAKGYIILLLFCVEFQ